jgi:hypothetical protein
LSSAVDTADAGALREPILPPVSFGLAAVVAVGIGATAAAVAESGSGS